jgi:hypothetical protein
MHDVEITENSPEDDAMQMIRIVAVLTSALLLAACGQRESASRGGLAQENGLTLATQGPDAVRGTATVLAPLYAVQGVNVIVPSDLRTSEANAYYPLADIVWRGEPVGNRHEQVRQIFGEALGTATAGMANGRAAIVDVTVTRFHCLTEKTRYSVGGTHSMQFTLTVRDALTGQVIDGPRPIVADVKAAGGQRALAEDAAGRTQRVVVMERLVYVLRRELSGPVANTARSVVSRADAAPATIAN